MFFIITFTCCLLLMLIAPSWSLFWLLLLLLSVWYIIYMYLVEKERYTWAIFINLWQILLWWLVCLAMLFFHSSQYQSIELDNNKSRREWEKWWSVLLSGTVIDFRRNNTLVLWVWEQEQYILREVEDTRLYMLWSQLLVSGYESTSEDHYYTTLWERFWWWSFLHESVPSLFISWFDYDSWRHMKGYTSDIYVTGIVNQWELAISYLDRQKNSLRSIVSQFSEKREINALLLGMLIGDVSWMSQEQYDRYIQSGLVHIVAVSGGNMLMLIVLLRVIFFWLPYYPRLFVILLFMCVYALLCGLDSSVFRALIMGTLTLWALFMGRAVSIWRAMAIARCIILIYSPLSLLYDVWFLLSFAALWSIVVFTRWFALVHDAPLYVKYIYEYLGITLAANIWVFPILILFMWQMNIIWFLWNILVLPLVACIMVLWLVYICSTMLGVSLFFNLWGQFLLCFVDRVAMYSQQIHITLVVNTISSKISVLLIYVLFLLMVYKIYIYRKSVVLW